MGLLICREEGRQKYCQVNRGSAVYEELRGLAVKTSGVADILREALSPLNRRIRAAFLIGSFAEGRENAQSDVDLVVVGSVTFADVSKALTPAQVQLGREVNPTVYPEAELASKAAEGHHFVNSILEGKKIFLIGSSDDLTRLAKKRPSH